MSAIPIPAPSLHPNASLGRRHCLGFGAKPMAQGFNPFDAILDKRHYQDPDFRAQSSPFLLAWVQRLVRAP